MGGGCAGEAGADPAKGKGVLAGGSGTHCPETAMKPFGHRHNPSMQLNIEQSEVELKR